MVLVHGFDSGPEIWRGTARILQERGYLALPVLWAPEAGQRAPQVATQVLLPRIREALSAAGIPPESGFHVITHSLGGLLLRFLLEHPGEDADEPLSNGSWRGDGVPDGDPNLRQQVRSLIMLSTPNQGARTGVARMACSAYHRKEWRPLGCDMLLTSPFQTLLGTRKPSEVDTPYLAIGVEAPAPLFFAPPYDGDGDGQRAGHDNAVMAEAAQLDGAPFVVWRGWRQADHFHSTCSETVNGWFLSFLDRGAVPEPSTARSGRGDACRGLAKGAWRKAWELRQDAAQSGDRR
ncbi:MAG TPA: hypothetical protein DIU15_10295 [Deltaproteobacteria bacterium]|nr:hypothetical protein [Deltaproteobacteria bacterium]